MNTLKNLLPNQTVVGIVLGIFALIVPFYIYFLERETKSLQVIVLANTPIVSVVEEFADDVQLSYRGGNVENLALVQLRIENNGDQVITRQDYDEPIRFVFPDQSRIVSSTVIDAIPQNIGVSLFHENNIVTLSPVLINSKDRFVVRLLVENVPESNDNKLFSVEARIVGIHSISVLSAVEEVPQVEGPASLVMASLGSGALLLIIFGGYTAVTSGGEKLQLNKGRMLVILGVLGLFFIISFFFAFQLGRSISD